MSEQPEILFIDDEQDLRLALEREELVLCYQPIMRVDGQPQLVAVEALLRWRHPRRGIVSPDQFIPLAEETGLIGPIGRWVLSEACRQTSQWLKDGLALTLHVNLSSRQLALGLAVEELQALLRGVRAGLAELDVLLGRGVDQLTVSAQQLLSQDGLAGRVEQAAAELEQGYERELDAVLLGLSGRVDAAAARTVEHLDRLAQGDLLSPREQLERRLIQASLALYGPLDK